MIPKKLTLKGFSGITSGMGKDEIRLDLDRMAGDASIVALVGPNGAGKSTIMDNLQPYRLMPSRSSGYSPTGFSYYEHMSQPEAMKELIWEHGGVLYRSTLVLKTTARTKKQENYLHAYKNGRFEPFTANNGTVSDGKSETYDRCLEDILGNPETFFTSVFSAQNRQPLSSYTNGEIKGLMADLLGLEKIRLIGAKAADVAKKLRMRLEETKPETARAELLKQRRESEKIRLESEKSRHAALQSASAVFISRIEKAQEELANAKVKNAVSAETVARRTALEERIAQEKLRHAGDVNLLQESIRTVRSRKRRLLDDLAAFGASVGQRLSALRNSLSAGERLLERKAEIMAAQASLAMLNDKELFLQNRIAELRAKADETAADQKTLSALTGKITAIEGEGAGIKRHLNSLRQRSCLVSQVPCHGADIQPACPLLKDAVSARPEMTSAQKKIAELRASWKDLTAQAEPLRSRLRDTIAPDDLRKAEMELTSIRIELRNALKKAAMSAAVEEAERNLSSIREQCTEQEKSLAEQQAAAEAAVAEADAEEKSLAGRLESAEKIFVDGQHNLEQELNGLPSAMVDEVAVAEQALVSVKLAAEAHSAEASVSARSVAEVESALVRIQAEMDVLASISAKAAKIEEELPHWSLMAKAFGNDGIVALSIDDAGPTLTSIVNDLLLACYGPRFTVSIQTQTTTAKGELREGFDLLVYDADRDETKSVAVMSGGERVWINEALTRAIALYLAQNSGNDYLTLFSDEADGPLDTERKQQFMKMKRQVLEIGGYRREIFVSQTPELWSMADVIIDVSSL